MNRKSMPLVMMLIAGAVISIITYVRNYSIVGRLTALLVVLVIFYVLGSVLRWVLDTFDRQNEIQSLEEGEVTEKEISQGEEAEVTAEE